MIKPDKRAEYYHKKSHMEHNLQRVILEDGVAYIPCRIDGLSDIVSKFSIEGAESLDGEFVDYVLDFVDIIPVEYPVILEIYGPNFPEETKQFITELIKVEGGYFVHIIGPDGFEQWAAERKTQMIDRLSEEDLERVTSFLNDAKGEEYERDSALFGQLWFNAAHFRMADEQVNGGGKSYIYYFTPESTVPYIKSGHATEIAGIFNHPDDTVLTGRTFDETFSGIMRKMWIQFAKIGNPSLSADISPDWKAYEWPFYDQENKEVMVFDEFNIHPEKESERKMVDWERMYPLTGYYLLWQINYQWFEAMPVVVCALRMATGFFALLLSGSYLRSYQGTLWGYESFSWTPQAERFNELRDEATARMLGTEKNQEVSDEEAYEGIIKYLFGM